MILINEIEVATEVAEYFLLNEFHEEEVYEIDEDGNEIYTENAQEHFNVYYDVVLNILKSCRKKKKK